MMKCYSLLTAALFLTATCPAWAQDCYDNLDAVFEDISEVDIPKRYILCPNTVFDLGNLVPGEGVTGGQSPLIPRPNTLFLCGEDGSSDNNCILRGGDYGFISVPVFFPQDASVNNVLVRGITFEGQAQYGVFLGMPGDITFEDCIVRNQENFSPVLVNYDAPAVDNPGPLDVTFSKSLFTNNTQAPDSLGVENGVMAIKGDKYTTVTVDDCIFTENQFGSPLDAPIGYAIQAFPNTKLILKNTCFVDNNFLGGGTVVVAEESFFVLIGNYADGGADFILLCEFVARYPTELDRANLNPTCIPSQSEACTMR